MLLVISRHELYIVSDPITFLYPASQLLYNQSLLTKLTFAPSRYFPRFLPNPPLFIRELLIPQCQSQLLEINSHKDSKLWTIKVRQKRTTFTSSAIWRHHVPQTLRTSCRQQHGNLLCLSAQRSSGRRSSCKIQRYD